MGTELSAIVPPQLSGGDAVTLQKSTKVLEDTVKGLIAANFGLSIFFAIALQLIWKMLATIQIMLHTPMFGIAYPANARLVFSVIIDLSNLKLIKVDWILKWMLGITIVPKNSPLSKEAEFGYTGNFA